MEKTKVLELFAGIGAQQKAFTNIDWHVDCDIVEFDKHAVASYNAIHGTDHRTQDIRTFDGIQYRAVNGYVDIVTDSSPCTQMSKAGKNQGGTKDSGTASALMWESSRIYAEVEPSVIVWENVATAVSGTNEENFKSFVKVLTDLGYKVAYNFYTGDQFGMAQERKRVFLVAKIRGELFNFENVDKLKKPAKHASYFLEGGECETYESLGKRWAPFVPTNSRTTKLGYFPNLRGEDRPEKRVYSTKGVIPALTCANPYWIDDDGKPRKLTNLERFKLMGFEREDYFKAAAVTSQAQLTTQTGNTVIVPILEAIYTELLNTQDWRKIK